MSVYIKIAKFARKRIIITGDEFLEEYHYESRTSPANMDWRYTCTPSVFRFYPKPIEKSGDYRVNISPLLDAYLVLNGEKNREDPKSRYLFDPGTALFNSTGYPRQAYVSMSGNELRGVFKDNWFVFETLTSWASVKGITHETHPWFVHRFDLVCWDKQTKSTRHHPNTPRGIIQYFLVTNEGYAYIPKRHVREVQ